jgi:hypothetical protein
MGHTMAQPIVPLQEDVILGLFIDREDDKSQQKRDIGHVVSVPPKIPEAAFMLPMNVTWKRVARQAATGDKSKLPAAFPGAPRCRLSEHQCSELGMRPIGNIYDDENDKVTANPGSALENLADRVDATRTVTKAALQMQSRTRRRHDLFRTSNLENDHDGLRVRLGDLPSMVQRQMANMSRRLHAMEQNG